MKVDVHVQLLDVQTAVKIGVCTRPYSLINVIGTIEEAKFSIISSYEVIGIQDDRKVWGLSNNVNYFWIFLRS